MLRIPDRALAAQALNVLDDLQSQVDAEPNYPAKVQAAKKAWETKTSTKAKADAFRMVRDTLAKMCVGPVRCGYCEDSLADEVEHIRPKSFFPEHVFNWGNYLFACGPCNGPKGNRYGVMAAEVLTEIVRKHDDPVVPPPPGLAALINPRLEDPLEFLELDLGGTTPEGDMVLGTFDFVPLEGASDPDFARADFSIEVLGLNREVMRVARENAFGGFRARLREYVHEKKAGAAEERLGELREDLLSTPHLTVFAEMRRQKALLPAIKVFFDEAPEAETWPITPGASQG